MAFSDKNYGELIEDFPEALLLGDLEGNILEVNSQACDILGCKREELLEMNVEDIVPDEAPAFLPDQINELAETNGPLKTIDISKDGSRIPIKLSGRIIEVDGEKRILISLRNVAERKQVKKQYQIVTEGSSQAIYLFQEGGFQYVNEAFLKLSGYSRKELKNLDYLELVHPDFREKVLNWTKQAMTGDSSGLPERVEYKIQTKDGDTRWVRSLPSLIEYQGKPAVVGNAVDITDEKGLANQLRQYKMAVEESEEPMAACDRNYNYLFANKAYRSFYQVGKEEVERKKLGDLIEQEKLEEVVKPLVDRCLDGESIDYEMEREHPELGTRYLRIIYYPLKSGEEIQGMVAVMRDITNRKEVELEIDRERRKLMQLHETLDALQRQKTEEELLQTTVDLAENILDFEICAISMVEGDYLVPRANSTKLDRDQTSRFRIGEGIAGKTVAKGQTIWGDDVRSHPLANPTNEGFRAFISVPIGDIGNFQVVSKKVGSFNEQDVGLAEILVKHLREELRRVRLEEELRHKADSIQATKDKLESLHKVARKLESSDRKDEIYRLGIEAAVETLDFLVCSFSVAEGDSFEVKATSSEKPFNWVHKNLSIEEGLTGKTYQAGETYLYDDVRDIEEAKPVRSEYRSVISTPLGDIGVFQVLSEKEGAFSEEDTRHAELLAGHVYEAIKRVNLENELKEQAIHDPLTGLHNRRYFTENLSTEVERSERYYEPLAFLMIDINRFKEVNDRYSHQKGDRVLKEIANLLQQNVRNADTVVRYGGDEFLIMMPETNGGVKRIVARLNEELEKWNDRTRIIDFPLTLAMGISHWAPDQGRRVEEALKEADRKMYEDKGR